MMKRREVLHTILMGLLGHSDSKRLKGFSRSTFPEIKRGQLPKRTLGRTGEKLSILGFGGSLLTNEGPESANRVINKALEQGINYFDFAPSYGDAESLLGPALKPFRKNLFLACKTMNRDRTGALNDLHRSLKRLQTDYFDLYQLHLLRKKEEVDRAFGPGGAMEVFVKATEEGKIRFIGFSAHSYESAFACLERYNFDTILFPINYVCFFKAKFGPELIEKARERNMGIIALKAGAHQVWPDMNLQKKWPKLSYQPILDSVEANLSLRFALSTPVTAAIPPAYIELFERDLEIAQSFSPLNEKEEKYLHQLSLNLKPIFEL